MVGDATEDPWCAAIGARVLNELEDAFWMATGQVHEVIRAERITNVAVTVTTRIIGIAALTIPECATIQGRPDTIVRSTEIKRGRVIPALRHYGWGQGQECLKSLRWRPVLATVYTSVYAAVIAKQHEARLRTTFRPKNFVRAGVRLPLESAGYRESEREGCARGKCEDVRVLVDLGRPAIAGIRKVSATGGGPWSVGQTQLGRIQSVQPMPAARRGHTRAHRNGITIDEKEEEAVGRPLSADLDAA